MAQKKQMCKFSEPYTEEQKVFLSQREAHVSDPFPDYARRIENLNKLETLISENTEAIVEAIYSDFGHRSHIETKFLEVFPALSGIRYTLRHLKGWMKPKNRAVQLYS